MLPKLNEKSFLNCTELDLQALLDNPDYRENEYIDYKENFTFLEMVKTDPRRQRKIAEFRNDVCAFANADGGYLIYGITDVNGMAKEIIGIDIPDNNTDKFELDRKNNLSPIMPKMPSIQFGFIKLSTGKFVVMLYVRKDHFVPYIHLEDDTNYKIYKRVGNGKTPIRYAELKNMFNQSLSIEKEVYEFRKQRIDYYLSQEDTPTCRFSKFVHFHIIPDTFTDSSYRKNMFLLYKQRPDLKLNTLFSDLHCSYYPRPNVDGLRYVDDDETCIGLLYNNSIAECHLPAMHQGYYNPDQVGDFFQYHLSWYDIRSFTKYYLSIMEPILDTQRVFLCISVIGCKGIVTDGNIHSKNSGRIDRDILLCNPVVIEDLHNDHEIDSALKWLNLEYYLSLGIRKNEVLDKLMSEVQ